MALEETVVTGKRLKPKTGDEWYSSRGLIDAYTGREVISDPRNIEYDPNDPRESSPLTEEGSLIPTDELPPKNLVPIEDWKSLLALRKYYNKENNPISVNTDTLTQSIYDTAIKLNLNPELMLLIPAAETDLTMGQISSADARGIGQVKQIMIDDINRIAGNRILNKRYFDEDTPTFYTMEDLGQSIEKDIEIMGKGLVASRTYAKDKNSAYEVSQIYKQGIGNIRNEVYSPSYDARLSERGNAIGIDYKTLGTEYNPVNTIGRAKGGITLRHKNKFKASLKNKNKNKFISSLRAGGIFKSVKSKSGKTLKEVNKEVDEKILIEAREKAQEILSADVKDIAFKQETSFKDDFLKNYNLDELRSEKGKSIKELKSEYELKDSQRKVQDPELLELVNKLKNEEVTSQEYKEAVERINPVKVLTKLPDPVSAKTIKATVGKKAENKIIGQDIILKKGEPLESRIDISAFDNFNKYVTSVHESRTGNIVGYAPGIYFKNITVSAPRGGAMNIAAGANKSSIARIKGTFESSNIEEIATIAQKEINNPNSEWSQIGYNPHRTSYFYNRKTGINEVLQSGDEMVQIGNLVLVKNAIFIPREEFLEATGVKGFNKGGTVIPRFNEGGTIFTGPDTSTPFTKRTSPAKEQREADRAMQEQMADIETAYPELPAKNFAFDDGVIKSTHPTGTLTNTTVAKPMDKGFLTRPTATEPSAALPSGTTFGKLTRKTGRGIDIPSGYAAAAALGTAGYLYSKGFVFSKPVSVPFMTGSASSTVTGQPFTPAGQVAGQVIGAGATLFSLYDMWKNGISYENALGAAGGAATFVASSVGAQSALGVGAAGTKALAVLGPVMLGTAAVLVLKDMFDRPSNKTGIAYSDLSTEDFTIEGMPGDKYHPDHVDAARSLLTPTLEYIQIMEEEYSTTIGGHLQMQVGGERGIEVIISSEDGRIYLEKDFGMGEDAVGKMFEWFDDLVKFTAETGIQDIAYASAIMNDEYMYTKGYAVEHKNKYHWYQVAGRHEGNPANLDTTRLGTYYPMADDRTAHNTEFEKVRQETEASILAWRNYLRTVYEDLSTTTTHITPSYRNQPFPGLRKGGTIQKPKPLSRKKGRRQHLAALQTGGIVASPWSGGSGTIYEQPSGPTPSQDVTRGLLSPRSMATY